MVLLAAALAREARIVPRVRVIVLAADGAAVNDPLEFAPIATTIADIVRSCGAVPPATAHAPTSSSSCAFRRRTTPTSSVSPTRSQRSSRADGGRVARPSLADLAFLEPDPCRPAPPHGGSDRARRLAGSVAAFASWNTVANTVGTALPEAIAALRRQTLGTYDARAHATFTFMRYVDDVAFHADVRPKLNAGPDRAGVADHTLLPPAVARRPRPRTARCSGPTGSICSPASSRSSATPASRSRCRGTARSRPSSTCDLTPVRSTESERRSERARIVGGDDDAADGLGSGGAPARSEPVPAR